MSGLKKKFSIDKGIYLCLVGFSYLLPAATLAQADEPKRTLKDNNEEVYQVLPEHAATLTGAFAKGVFYGRLRMNYFYWDFENSDQYDPTGFAVGGSVIYKPPPTQFRNCFYSTI